MKVVSTGVRQPRAVALSGFKRGDFERNREKEGKVVIDAEQGMKNTVQFIAKVG